MNSNCFRGESKSGIIKVKWLSLACFLKTLPFVPVDQLSSLRDHGQCRSSDSHFSCPPAQLPSSGFYPSLFPVNQVWQSAVPRYSLPDLSILISTHPSILSPSSKTRIDCSGLSIISRIPVASVRVPSSKSASVVPPPSSILHHDTLNWRGSPVGRHPVVLLYESFLK